MHYDAGPRFEPQARHTSPGFALRQLFSTLLTALALFAFAQDASAEREFRKLGVGRGLEANVVPAMLVDRDGLLWVGSREGLFSYDGYLATAYRSSADHTGSISDVDVRSLYQARDGALWVSTNTGGLNRRDPVTGQFTQFHHDSANPRSLSAESVYGVAQDANGNLWVATQNGLNRLDANGREFTRFFHQPDNAASLASNWVFPLHLGQSKRLWIGTVGGGVDRWDETTGSFEHFSLSKLTNGDPAYDVIYALHETADGRVWVGTRMGLVVLDPVRNTASRVDLATVPKDEYPLVTALYADKKGRLWIATIEHGVLLLDPATGSSMRPHAGALGEPGSLPDSEYISLAGTDNTIFVGTWGSGVYSAPLEEPQFWLLTPEASGTGLQTGNVTAVLGDASAGKPWVGSFGGGTLRVDVLTSSSAPTGRNPQDDSEWRRHPEYRRPVRTAVISPVRPTACTGSRLMAAVSATIHMPQIARTASAKVTWQRCCRTPRVCGWERWQRPLSTRAP